MLGRLTMVFLDEKEIFLRALELEPSGQRATYLDDICGAGTALRSKVDRLLEASTELGKFLETPAIIGSYQITDPSDSPECSSLEFLRTSDRPGSLGKIGHYEAESLLGQGGSGIVLKAFDGKLHRYVAVKVLSPLIATNPTARKRFLREAHAAAAISHQNVATIYAIDEDDNLPFLAMELIDGKTLQQKIEENGALPVELALQIGLQVSKGLAAAHEQGLIHRDIKPANILITDEYDVVKITDFGLARSVDDVAMTQPGFVGGTPQYMSPEQAGGKTLDHRTDIFSLGSVLFAMCVGRSPFHADSTIAVIKRICEDDYKQNIESKSNVPSCMINLLDRLLAKNRDDRFQSAIETADAIASTLEDWQSRSNSSLPVYLNGENKATHTKTEKTLPARELHSKDKRAKARRNGIGLVIACLLAFILTFTTLELVGFTGWFSSERSSSSNESPPTGLGGDLHKTPVNSPWTSDEWKWTKPVRLANRINATNYTGSPALTKDGLKLYFVSNRSEGYGGTDIWMTRRPTLDHPFGNPVQLGPSINTSSDERNVTITADAKIILFTRNSQIWAVHHDQEKQRILKVDSPIGKTPWRQEPAISGDGLELVVALRGPGSTEPYDGMWYSKRATTDEPFVKWQRLNQLTKANESALNPTISTDGLVLIWTIPRRESYRSGDLHWSTRPNRTDSFGPPKLIDGVINDGSYNLGTAFSTDKGIFIFSADRDDQAFGLWQSKRMKRH